MPLTDIKCKNAKPLPTRHKNCSNNPAFIWKLCLMAPSTGGINTAIWVKKRLAIGVYPIISLKDAREKRDEARKLLAAGKILPQPNSKTAGMPY